MSVSDPELVLGPSCAPTAVSKLSATAGTPDPCTGQSRATWTSDLKGPHSTPDSPVSSAERLRSGVLGTTEWALSSSPVCRARESSTSSREPPEPFPLGRLFLIRGLETPKLSSLTYSSSCPAPGRRPHPLAVPAQRLFAGSASLGTGNIPPARSEPPLRVRNRLRSVSVRPPGSPRRSPAAALPRLALRPCWPSAALCPA